MGSVLLLINNKTYWFTLLSGRLDFIITNHLKFNTENKKISCGLLINVTPTTASWVGALAVLTWIHSHNLTQFLLYLFILFLYSSPFYMFTIFSFFLSCPFFLPRSLLSFAVFTQTTHYHRSKDPKRDVAVHIMTLTSVCFLSACFHHLI